MNKKDRKEQIQCAAIWFKFIPDIDQLYPHQPINIKSGFVIGGLRHCNCFSSMSNIALILASEISLTQFEYRQGFLTNKNRFVDREEAAKIAFEAGQISEKKKTLSSEDLY